MKRSKWNTFDVIDRVGPCNALMIVGQKRWQVAEGLIVSIYVAADELKATETSIYVCDDGWGNALVLREPVPEQFVEALLSGIPNARVVPVDFDDAPTRLLMSVGRRGVTVHADPVMPGYVGAAPDGNRWDSYGENWGSEWTARRYYDYRKRKAKTAAAGTGVPVPSGKDIQLEKMLMPTRNTEPGESPPAQPPPDATFDF